MSFQSSLENARRQSSEASEASQAEVNISPQERAKLVELFSAADFQVMLDHHQYTNRRQFSPVTPYFEIRTGDGGAGMRVFVGTKVSHGDDDRRPFPVELRGIVRWSAEKGYYLVTNGSGAGKAGTGVSVRGEMSLEQFYSEVAESFVQGR